MSQVYMSIKTVDESSQYISHVRRSIIHPIKQSVIQLLHQSIRQQVMHSTLVIRSVNQWLSQSKTVYLSVRRSVYRSIWRSRVLCYSQSSNFKRTYLATINNKYIINKTFFNNLSNLTIIKKQFVLWVANNRCRIHVTSFISWPIMVSPRDVKGQPTNHNREVMCRRR